MNVEEDARQVPVRFQGKKRKHKRRLNGAGAAVITERT
jgi:hypothetical protein